MLRHMFFVAVVLLVLASRAQAATIDLQFTVEHYAPPAGPSATLFNYTFFQSATNGWPGAFPPQPYLASGSVMLLPGTEQFHLSMDVASLDHVYFNAWGTYWSDPSSSVMSIYVAEPPTGAVPDALAYAYGPPWISMANGAGGLSGELRTVSGVSSGPIGTWQVTVVPEPASLLLLGSGVAALAAARYRRSRA